MIPSTSSSDQCFASPARSYVVCKYVSWRSGNRSAGSWETQTRGMEGVCWSIEQGGGLKVKMRFGDGRGPVGGYQAPLVRTRVLVLGARHGDHEAEASEWKDESRIRMGRRGNNSGGGSEGGQWIGQNDSRQVWHTHSAVSASPSFAPSLLRHGHLGLSTASRIRIRHLATQADQVLEEHCQCWI